MKKRIIKSIIYLTALLPLNVLYLFADIFAFLMCNVVKYRRKLVRKNLSMAFPEKSDKELKQIEKDFYRFLCDNMIETVKLAHIGEKELSRRIELVDVQYINNAGKEGRSSVVFLGHYGNWEWVQEMVRDIDDNIFKGSIYHPVKSRVWDEIFLELRGRWKAHIVPQNKSIKTMLDKENQPWVFGFIADQRPSPAFGVNWLDFLDIETEFITGPEDIGRKIGAAFFYLDVERLKRGYYRLTLKPLTPDPDADKYPLTHSFWKEFEKTVRRNPALWLWSHNRWKYKRKIK